MSNITQDNSRQGAPSRRALLQGLALGGLSVAAVSCGVASGGSAAAPATTVPVPSPSPGPTTPDGALQRLMAGNDRLLANKTLHTQTLDGIRQHAESQAPYAQVFGCADSRVPVEAIFDEDFGDVFVTRTAGNVLSEPTVGTIEYGVAALGTPLIMVLGHQSCGAVKAAVEAMKDPAKMPAGALGALVAALVPAAQQVKDRGADIYAAALEAHILKTVETLQASPVIKTAVSAGRLRVIGASYDLATAKVTLYK
jgi:carbonic anhydrase